MILSSFASLASSNVLSASRLASPSVSRMRILGTPLRAPFDGSNTSSRAVRSAAAMFVCPPPISTLSMAVSRDSRPPCLLRWKTISASLLNLIKPTCVRFLSMGNASAILLTKPSTSTYQFSYSGSPTTILVDWSSTNTMSAALGHVMLLTTACTDLITTTE